MQNKKLKLSAILVLFIGLTGLHAQNAIPVSGGNASGSGGSVSYSVGQIFYTTYTGMNGSLAQGVQQPYEISVVSGIEEAKGISLSVSAYPNPTTDYLILEVMDFDLSALTFLLYDMNGKLLQNKKITSNRTSIFMGNLAPATYFVKIKQGSMELKVFGIVKD
jgi:Secretion system C-terminal sorting domain